MSLIFKAYAVALDGKVLARLDGVVDPGTVWSIMGASGAGKSSLLQGIAGFLAPAFTVSGAVLLDGVDILTRPPEERGVGIMFQNALLFPHMSVLGNVLFAVPRRDGGETLDRRARRGRALAALDRVGLRALERREPETLSGGQRSRVALARTLAGAPKALLLDEPFAALDQALRSEMRRTVFGLARQDGLPVVLVSHDPADAEAAGGPVVALDGLPSPAAQSI
ncbi:MAG: ATP-binding cassette domain-containing protein [Pseudomonadota bacterium]